MKLFILFIVSLTLTSINLNCAPSVRAPSKCPRLTLEALKAFETQTYYNPSNTVDVFQLSDQRTGKKVLAEAYNYVVGQEVKSLKPTDQVLRSKHKKYAFHCTYPIPGKHSKQYLHVTMYADFNKLPDDALKEIAKRASLKILATFELLNKRFAKIAQLERKRRGIFVLNMKGMNANQVRQALTQNQQMKLLVINNYNKDIFINALRNNPNLRLNKLKSFTLKNSPIINEPQPLGERERSFFKDLDREFFSKAPNVESLDLSGTKGGYLMVEAIAFSRNLNNLKSLTLVDCAIPQLGVNAINLGGKKLTALNLARNNLRLGGVRTALNFDSTEQQTLKSLNLTDNDLNRDMASTITYDLIKTNQRNPKVANLDTFYLSKGNNFTEEQLQRISRAYPNVRVY